MPYFILLLILGAARLDAHGRGELLPLGMSGAPGEASCTQCHNSTINSRSGRAELLFQTLLRYSPGVKQRVTLRMLSGGLPNNGFQLSARLADNSQAGTFSLPLTNTVVQRTANGIDYLAHFTSGIGATVSFAFDWTPPANATGEIRFYVQAVSGNGDGTASSLDNTYSTTVALTPEALPEPAGFRITNRFQAFQSSTTAYGVSNDGRLAGTYGISPVRPFLRTVDGAISTFDVPGALNAWAYAINSSGNAVGVFDTASSSRKRAFRRAVTGEVTTFDVPGALETVLTDINDAGRMAGYFLDSSNVLQGILVEPDGSFQITEAPVNRLLGVSAAGNTVGLTDTNFFLAATPSARALLFVSCDAGEKAGINDRGEVVTPCRYAHPSGRTINLSSLFGSSFFSINNAGVIAGSNLGQGVTLESCPAATLTTTSATVPSDGFTGTIGVSGIADCRYVFESEAPWVQVDGSGRYTVAVNPTGLPRTAVIRAAGQVFTINQSATACNYSFTGGVPTVGWPGGTFSLSIVAPEGCAWTAAVNVPWITITNAMTGSGNGALNYTIQANPNTTVRTAIITVADRQFIINQAGGPGCTYTLSSTAFNYMIEGGAGTVTVTTQPGCPWTATTNSSWITFPLATSGAGSGPLAFRVEPNTGPIRSGNIALAGLNVLIQQQGAVSAEALRFVPVTPCRAVDTRAEGGKSGGFGPPRMAGQTAREFVLPQSGCGIPTTVRAYSLNITVVPPAYLGFVTVWPTGTQQPFVSTLNSWNGRVVANAAIVPAGAAGAISLYVSNDTDVIIDVNGYFVPATQAETLAFYPVTPCRISDTRSSGGKTGSYGPPAIAGQTSRTVNVPASGCGIPSTARAFSLNVTAVPPAYLGFVTLWPGGQAQPLASTLNSWDGTVVPNAAIVPAGANGDVSVYASNNTDLVIDINGYFAPPGLPGALSFYTVNPCRVADTRFESGKTGPFGPPVVASNTTRTLPMTDAGCNLPSTARAYSVNMTAVPPGYLGYVTTWPAGQPIPLASTLNSWNGQVVANAALVPAGTNGTINVFASNVTDIIIDVNGYFAP